MYQLFFLIFYLYFQFYNGGGVLAVSQFTLLGDARGQNRPGFTQAEKPERANELYELCCDEMRKLGVAVENGEILISDGVAVFEDGSAVTVSGGETLPLK